MLGTKEALMHVSRSTTDADILFKFLLKKIPSICAIQKIPDLPKPKQKQKQKSFLAFWVWHATRLPSKVNSVLILRYCTCKVSGCSLPSDNVNQLEMEAISLWFNQCMAHQNLHHKNSLPKLVGNLAYFNQLQNGKGG